MGLGAPTSATHPWHDGHVPLDGTAVLRPFRDALAWARSPAHPPSTRLPTPAASRPAGLKRTEMGMDFLPGAGVCMDSTVPLTGQPRNAICRPSCQRCTDPQRLLSKPHPMHPLL